MDLSDQIKSKISIEQLVSQYVNLKQSGRNLKGLCPFHQEKSPSFMVSPEKQIAWCFGCQKGGDIFSFIQEIERCDFKDAINILAEKAGVEIKSEISKTSTYNFSNKEEKDVLRDINFLASEFYHEQLLYTDEAKKVLQYLKSRGINDEMIKVFSLGFAMDSFDSLSKFLLEKGFAKRDILKSGLASSKDMESDNIYDKFRLRLMFPIRDARGNFVAFGGRVLKAQDEPKYLNSPETPIYNKSQIMYNFDLAKDEIKKKDEVLVVEGYMDVIASFQAGVKNVVAVSGTSLTNEHLNLLKRFTKNLIFAFDNDNAGMMAMIRAIKIAQKYNFNIYILTVPEGKDPGDYATKNPSAWCEIAGVKTSYVDYFIKYLKEKFDFTSIDGAKKAQDFVIPILAGISDNWEKERVVEVFALAMKMPKHHLLDKVKVFEKSNKLIDRDFLTVAEISLRRRANEQALEYIFAFDDLLEANFTEFMALASAVPDLELAGLVKDIYNKVLEYYTSVEFGNDINKFSFSGVLSRQEQEYIKVLQLKFGEYNLAEEQRLLIFQSSLSKLKERMDEKKRINFKSSNDFDSIEVLNQYRDSFIL